jgi:hypothetical protein
MSRPELDCPARTDNDGAYALRWTGEIAITWRLEENGAVVYEGADTATTVTGRAAGVYEYRVAASHDGVVASVSAPCLVEVAPPSLALAFALAAVGAAVFVAVLWLVVTSERAERVGEVDRGASR